MLHKNTYVALVEWRYRRYHMKFQLLEGNNDSPSRIDDKNVEEYLWGALDKYIGENGENAIVDMVGFDTSNKIQDGAMLVTKGGTIIYDDSGDSVHMELIQDIVLNVLWHYYPDADIEIHNMDLLLDPMTRKLGWARLNTGSTWVEGRFYCVLPENLTSRQMGVMDDFFQYGEEHDKKDVMIFVLVGDNDDRSHTYKYGYDWVSDSYITGEDILKKLKRFYSSGKFYESVDMDEEWLDEKTYTIQQLKKSMWNNTYKGYMKGGYNSEEYSSDMVDKMVARADEEDWEYAKNWVNSLKFPLQVYRGIVVDDVTKKLYGGDGINMDKLGRHWTTDPKMFFNNGTIGNSKMNFIFVCTVDENDIDWANTMDMFMYYSIPNKTQYGAYPENEIYLKKNAKPKDVKVYSREEFQKLFVD